MKVPFPFYSVPLALIFLTACAPVSPTAVGIATGDAGGRLNASIGNLDAARPHTDAYGQGHIDSAKTNILSVLTNDLPIFQKAASALAAANAKIAALYADFWSPRQRAMFWTIVIVLGSCLIVAGILKEFAVVNPIFGIVGGLFGAIGTVGGSVIQSIFGLMTKGVVAMGKKLATPATVVHVYNTPAPETVAGTQGAPLAP